MKEIQDVITALLDNAHSFELKMKDTASTAISVELSRFEWELLMTNATESTHHKTDVLIAQVATSWNFPHVPQGGQNLRLFKVVSGFVEANLLFNGNVIDQFILGPGSIFGQSGRFCVFFVTGIAFVNRTISTRAYIVQSEEVKVLSIKASNSPTLSYFHRHPLWIVFWGLNRRLARNFTRKWQLRLLFFFERYNLLVTLANLKCSSLHLPNWWSQHFQNPHYQKYFDVHLRYWSPYPGSAQRKFSQGIIQTEISYDWGNCASRSES